MDIKSRKDVFVIKEYGKSHKTKLIIIAPWFR